MRKFEIGKRYKDGACVVEVVGRTEKTISFVMVQHAGRINERKSKIKKAKISNWEMREVFFNNCYQFEA